MIVVNCIGAGHWGPNLIKVFTTLPDVRVNLVCDASAERLDLVKQRIPGIRGFTQDADDAIDDPEADAVIIATPVHTHAEFAQRALNAGKHVFVEKPLCQNSIQGQVLVDTARQNNRLLCVGHVFLFNNAIRGVRNLIRRGELGRILYIYATRTNLGPVRSDVNALWDLASHDLSIFNYWLQDHPLTASAHGASLLNADIEDVVVAGFRYPDGINAYVHASWLNPRKVREIIVVGENKMVVWSDMDLNEPVRIYDKSVSVQREPIYSDSFGSFRMQVNNGDITIPVISGPEPLVNECSHFLECIRGDAVPVNSAEEALSILRALEAADQSLRKGSTVVSVRTIEPLSAPLEAAAS